MNWPVPNIQTPPNTAHWTETANEPVVNAPSICSTPEFIYAGDKTFEELCLTVEHLIEKLKTMPMDARVTTEGCDCFGPAATVELKDKKVLIGRGGY